MVNCISKHIKTFALLTAENPFVQRLPGDVNKERNDRLAELLKNGGYVFRTVIGQCGNKEHSHCVYNISLESAKCISAKFNQQSFVFGSIGNSGGLGDSGCGNRMTCSLYAYGQKHYARALERFRIDNAGISDEFYRKYPKFNPRLYVKAGEGVPLDDNAEGFMSVDFINDEEAIAAGREIDECARIIGERRFSRMLEESIDDKFTGRHQYQNRIMMYRASRRLGVGGRG